MMALAIQKFAIALCYTVKKDWIFEHLRLYAQNDGQDLAVWPIDDGLGYPKNRDSSVLYSEESLDI